MTTKTFAYTGSLQKFTVPAGVTTVNMTVAGATGGANGGTGGRGVILHLDGVKVSGGDVQVLVGGSGEVGDGGGGGGGGSFVYTAATQAGLLAAAGGGGGGGTGGGTGMKGLDASTGPAGVASFGGAGGTDGSGGASGGGNYYDYGSGGGGLLGAGGNSGQSTGGASIASGGAGGTSSAGGAGGYGGGGGGSANGGGGGGGYSGGGGAAASAGGGGGGSYSVVTPTSTDFNSSGNGSVSISYTAPRTVSFDSQGGSAEASQTVLNGCTATEPADPSRAGYTFSGWYTAASGGTKWNFSKDTVTSDTTLYAQWTATSPSPSTPAGPSATPVQPVSHDQPGLASTGVEISTLLYWALPMLLVGGLAVAATRRRRTRDTR
ncbi:InlB B-repeat-containing protein [Amycolatopsis sp. SID8362]|uniref:InlB B-repeat-containing protein n=1 Tax=Amycolatopsis sp. SID8362 TaxID=2690346 RepID=UPI0013D3816B|nr:InlB B-repeat-containing protein [Amycolatopsis sp. SID8362]NED46207.1 InlB B-repeat-containing protein [Amycolatopsis sp. SID8362]